MHQLQITSGKGQFRWSKKLGKEYTNKSKGTKIKDKTVIIRILVSLVLGLCGNSTKQGYPEQKGNKDKDNAYAKTKEMVVTMMTQY